MVERAKIYGCENVGFILDRGYFSTDNHKSFDKNAYDYILMTKGGSVFIRNAIEECIAVLKGRYKYFLSEYELFGKTIEKIFSIQKANCTFMFIIMG